MENEEKKIEWLDILDCNGHPTGNVHARGTAMLPGDYLGAAIVCVINSNGKMLVQQRVKEKGWGGKWDVTCTGAIQAGETPQKAAMRELKEEMGLTIDLNNVRPTIITSFSNGFSFAFVVKMDVDMDRIVLQREEVQDAKIADINEIKEMLETDQFVPYRSSWIDYVFDCARQEFAF